MCNLFKINAVLQIEIEQLEEKLKGIKRLNWLNSFVEVLSGHYKAEIASKMLQFDTNRSAADQMLAAALQI